MDSSFDYLSDIDEISDVSRDILIKKTPFIYE
jgi:hypothetical protein